MRATSGKLINRDKNRVAAEAAIIRSLYRSLLREASYLPDETAQSYHRRWIIHRFHSAKGRESGRDLKDLIYTARRGLNKLQRANQGDLRALTSVLYNAYGRVGKRRRELIEALRSHADEHMFPEDDTEVKRLLEKRREGDHLDAADKSPAVRTKLQALITSHMKTALPSTSPRKVIKKDKPVIPETNAWGRSMPLKRKANMEHRWWAETLDRLLPPLPRDEHERLRCLALCITPFPGIPQRRARPESPPPEPEFLSQRQIARFLKPIEHVEKVPFKESTKVHNITPRFMQRLWMRILNLCPVMIQDEKTKAWTVQWTSSARSMPITSIAATASASDLELFEGSTENEAPQPRKQKGHGKG